MPRVTRNRRRVPNTVNPESMELGQLLALPRQSLVLLASARHLVTTGSKAQLAERIHGFEHATPPPAAPIPAPNNATRLTVNVNETTGPATAFSEMQISQLRSLISAAVHNERVGSQQAPVLVGRPLLSPATPHPQPPSSAIDISTQNLNPPILAPGETAQNGAASPSTFGPNPPTANLVGTPGTSAPANNFPPLPQKILQRIIKREYIDFSDLLSDNLYPHPSLPAQNQYKLEVNPQDPSALAIVPSQQRKRRVDGLHSWLEAWNIYLRTVLHHFPLLAPDLIAYQDQICKFSRKFRASAWIMYDTAFRYMAASNPSLAWGRINDQLYNDILKEETLPFCISCHSYGHRTINCPTRSQANQSFRRPSAQAQQLTSGPTSSTTSTSKPPINTQQVNLSVPSPNFTCRDFNRRFCRRVNCHFLHICSNQGCGGPHPSTQCPKGVQQAAI